MRSEPNYPRGDNEQDCLEIIADLETENKRLYEENKALRTVVSAAIFLTDTEPLVVESMIEAALHPQTDPGRLKRVATNLDTLFAAVKLWKRATGYRQQANPRAADGGESEGQS